MPEKPIIDRDHPMYRGSFGELHKSPDGWRLNGKEISSMEAQSLLARMMAGEFKP